MEFKQQAAEACKGMPSPIEDVKQLKEVARLARRLARSQEKTARMFNIECRDPMVNDLLDAIGDLKIQLY